MAKIIGIVSGKGGVGKTTTALNLGLALQELGEQVIVVDGDIKNPNVGLYLGLYKFPTTLQNVMRGADIKDAQYLHSSGLRIIPASLSIDEAGVGFSRLKEVFNEMEGYVLIDFAPGLGREVLALLEICDNAIVVTNPNIPSITSTMRFISIIREMNKEVLGVIINRSGKAYEIKREDIEIICDAPIIGEIPEDENVRKSAMMKTPVLHYKPYSKAAIKFKGVAARLLDMDYEPPSFSNIRNIFSYFSKAETMISAG
ncbi:MAG: cell division ATPase MinD [Candidatus Aenigmarchaeota archaeon]|nr:cell division ATPase MinD [Candidatus Aenigmarchaeota archaeon]